MQDCYYYSINITEMLAVFSSRVLVYWLDEGLGFVERYFTLVFVDHNSLFWERVSVCNSPCNSLGFL